jgi:hypothetical protein
MKVLKWVFPTGAVLTIGGVFLCGLLERHSFDNTQDWEFTILSVIFMPALLLGSVLAIGGSLFDRRRLPVAQTRVRGLFCWLVGGISYLLGAATGNVHSWTFTFIFPAFVGLIAGAVLLSKLTDHNTEAKPTNNLTS